MKLEYVETYKKEEFFYQCIINCEGFSLQRIIENSVRGENNVKLRHGKF